MNMPAPKQRHTPGLWAVEKMFLGNAADRRTGFVVNGPDAEPLPVRICDLRCSPESPFAVTEANAQLIAAAPDLLARLKDSTLWLRAIAKVYPKDAENLNICAQMNEEQIRRAEGGGL